MTLERFFQRQIDEIQADRALGFYGAVLALTHVLAFLHWELVHPARMMLSNELIPICWPFFENCHEWRSLDAPSVRILLWLYGALAIACAGAFLHKRFVRPAAIGLGILMLLELLIVFQDYRLRLNQHYMAVWVTAVFLFTPDKRRLLRFLIVAFYVWAGVLKLDPAWLSGEALRGQLPAFVRPSLLVPACWYVVLLELFVVFGVFSKNRWIYWTTLGQLALFHLASWPIVNFYYPVLMLGLLAIFPLSRSISVEARPSTSWRAASIVVGSFSILQLVPRAFPGDPALTGQGRMFALHMFDAKVSCRGVAVIHRPGGKTEPMALNARLPTRIACDPIVYFNFARGICRARSRDPSFVDLDLLLRSRRGRDPPIDVVNIPSFCSSDVTYDVWRPNEWIHGT